MSNPEINTEKGWTEVIINGNCDFKEFYQAAEILQNQFGIHFHSKLNDFDTLYWDFQKDDCRLTLYYNVSLGLSIYPTQFKEATETENLAVLPLAEQLNEAIKVCNNFEKD